MTPEEILQQLNSFDTAGLQAVDPILRARLSSAAAKFSHALETPTDAITRVLISQPVEAITVRIAADLRVFSILGDKSLSLDELARKTGAEPELMERVLRSLNAFHAVENVGPNKYKASPSYAIFKDKVFEDAFGGCQDILNKSRQSLPAYLGTTNYKNPRDPTDTAVQYAYGTKGKSYMESFMSDPASASAVRDFAVLMQVWAEGFTQVKEIYPVEERLQTGWDPETVMFVDVGGGHGQKATSLKKDFSSLPGRFIVQDLPHVIDSAPKDNPSYQGIELQAHDFLTEQPIKGARCYYMRQCLHNWADSAAEVILKRLAEAAKPDYSRILIHEVIVPEHDAGTWVVSQDFNMMSMFAVGERTEAKWAALCKRVGLKIAGIYLNDHPSSEGILEIVSE